MIGDPRSAYHLAPEFRILPIRLADLGDFNAQLLDSIFNRVLHHPSIAKNGEIADLACGYGPGRLRARATTANGKNRTTQPRGSVEKALREELENLELR